MSLLIDMINRASRTMLDTDPDSRDRLARLKGRVFCLELTVPAIRLYLKPYSDGIEIEKEFEGEPDVILKGSAMAFAQLGSMGVSSGVLSERRISMEGNAELGQELQKILSQLDLDWEELLAHRVGDFPARKIGNVIRILGSWANESFEQGRENLGEILQEEKKVLVTNLQMERFEKGVGELRSALDRLEQRTGTLERIEHDQNGQGQDKQGQGKQDQFEQGRDQTVNHKTGNG